MKRILFFAILFFPLLAFSQTRQDSVGVKTISSLTELTANVDTSYEVILHDPGTGKILYRASIGEFLKTIAAVPSVVGTSQIVNATIINEDISGSAAIALSKLQNLTANRLVGRDTTGTGVPESLTVGYGLQMGTDRIDVDTTSATGIASKDYVDNYMDDMGGGGSTETLADILGWYDVSVYGAVPNDGTDDTEAIQEAIDSCFNQGGGIIYFPKGIYDIKGALVTDVGGNNPNAQLYIPPQEDTTTNHVKIHLLGEVGPVYSAGGFGDIDNPETGVILRSSGVTGSGTFPSLFAVSPASASIGGYTFNRTTVEIENIIFRVPSENTSNGPSLCGVNLRESNQAIVNRVRIDIDTSLFRSAEPTNEVFGLAMPKRDNGTVSSIELSKVMGFRYGFLIAEHTTMDQIEARVNYYAFAFDGSAHTIHGNRIIAQWNKHVFLYDSSFPTSNSTQVNLKVDNLNIEARNHSPSKWYDNISTVEVVDAGNKIYGEVTYYIHLSGSGSPTWDQTGGDNLRAINLVTGSASSSDLPQLVTITADGTDTLDFENKINTYYHFLCSGISSSRLTFQNPATSGIPSYKIQFRAASDDVITFPPNVKFYNGTDLGTRTLAESKLLEIYYDGSTYWASDTLGVAVDPVDSTIVTSVAGLVAWYNVNSESYSEGAQIDTIHDRSGNNFHIAQSTSSKQPLFQVDATSGKPGAFFDGTDDYMDRDSLAAMNSGNDFTVFIAGKATDNNKANSALSTVLSTSTTSSRKLLYVFDTRTNKAATVVTTDAGTLASFLLTELDTVPALLTTTMDFTLNGGSYKTYKELVLQDTEPWLYTTDSYINEKLTIGSNANLGTSSENFFQGYIYEVIIYNSVLSDQDREDISSYLISKYNP